MFPKHSEEILLVGNDPETLMLDCRQIRRLDITNLPSVDEVIDFLDGYNSFINHAMRPYSPMREVTMLL
jgi:hypothetical protein